VEKEVTFSWKSLENQSDFYTNPVIHLNHVCIQRLEHCWTCVYFKVNLNYIKLSEVACAILRMGQVWS